MRTGTCDYDDHAAFREGDDDDDRTACDGWAWRRAWRRRNWIGCGGGHRMYMDRPCSHVSCYYTSA